MTSCRGGCSALAHVHAAVDVEGVAGDVGGVFGGKEGDGCGDVLLGAGALEGMMDIMAARCSSLRMLVMAVSHPCDKSNPATEVLRWLSEQTQRLLEHSMPPLAHWHQLQDVYRHYLGSCGLADTYGRFKRCDAIQEISLRYSLLKLEDVLQINFSVQGIEQWVLRWSSR